jgi:membrane-bound metal-dependent hydrolase YbcI (DUF457 family)
MNPVAVTTATSGAGAAAVSVLVWALGLFHITIPADVAASLVMLAAVASHQLAAILTAEKVLLPPAAPEAK